MAQTQPGPVSVHDSRLTVHTLVREDIFAGSMSNDEAHLANGERTLTQLLIERPNAKADILAWQGWAALTRAVYAHEEKNENEFAQRYRQASELQAEAAQLEPNSESVAILIGGSYAVLGDRLPNQYRSSAWSQAYTMYRKVWKRHSGNFDTLPPHLKGELLAGLAQTAQRTGRKTEMLEDLDVIVEKLPDTPYAARAKKWKENPEIASRTSIICQTCHEPGRLAVRTATLAAMK
ncbi:MAG: hypothetical protein M3Y57_10985 [Acidobacteriota bacterium]|nr:hypothetical protein [Acidobacteriota bacterium]